MNYKPKKYEVEVLKRIFGDELKMKKELNKVFENAIDEMTQKVKDLEDVGTTSKLYQAEFQKTLIKGLQGTLKNLGNEEKKVVTKYLENSYKTGYTGGLYCLNSQGIPYFHAVRSERVARAIKSTALEKTIANTLGKDATKLVTPIKNEIVNGLATGLRYNEIAQNITNKTNIARNRAQTIARTEGHRVANVGTYEAAQDAAEVVEIQKQWCATLDDRTRESHMMLDGEIVGMDEEFSNGLMYPGDPDGDPEEVINCRCTLLERPLRMVSDKDLKVWEVRSEELGVSDVKDFSEYRALLSKMSADD